MMVVVPDRIVSEREKKMDVESSNLKFDLRNSVHSRMLGSVTHLVRKYHHLLSAGTRNLLAVFGADTIVKTDT